MSVAWVMLELWLQLNFSQIQSSFWKYPGLDDKSQLSASMCVAQICWFLKLIWGKQMIMCLWLFVFMMPHEEREKQMISPSTQIIGEKPPTVIGPLWAIAYSRAALTLMMTSCAVWKCDLHSLASGWASWRKESPLPPLFMYPSQ